MFNLSSNDTLSTSSFQDDAFILNYIAQHEQRPQYLSSRLAVDARLGNHMFELISLYGISKTLNRTFIFWVDDEQYEEMLNKVKRILPGLMHKIKVIYAKAPAGLETVIFPDTRHTYSDPIELENRKDTLLHLSGVYYQSWKYFAHHRGEILSFLRPPKYFSNLPESTNNHKVTCIHIRRGDFIKNGRFTADSEFIKKALEAIEPGNPPNRSVVLFGDDQKFMSSLFNNTVPHYVSTNSPQDDLLYASEHCDTVLITAPTSTFGWWIGYLSIGDKVFYTDPKSVQGVLLNRGWIIPDDFYPLHWTPLKVANGSVYPINR